MLVLIELCRFSSIQYIYISIYYVLVSCIEDEAQIKSDCIISKDNIASPNKGRTRSGSNSTEMAVDQLQASEKLIAGKIEVHLSEIKQY